MKPTTSNNGTYIATESFKSKKVVASGRDIEKVYNDAKNKGIDEPVIKFVPKEGIICIF